MQEPAIQVAPEPPTESSFVESSFDAEPVDAPVTQPPPTMEVKKGRKSRMAMFKKRSEQEPKEPKPPRQKQDIYRQKQPQEVDQARQEQIAMDTFQVLILNSDFLSKVSRYDFGIFKHVIYIFI